MPILGERGQVVQCYGRKIRDDLREGTPTHLYLPGPHARVWNLEALTSSKEVILCEALFDAMTFWVGGFHYVTTSYGVSGFTEAHRAAFRLHGTERVLVAYDGDEAGERAAERVATELGAMGIACYRVHFPRGLDANAYALAHPPAAESLGALLRGATWMERSGAPRSCRLSPLLLSCCSSRGAGSRCRLGGCALIPDRVASPRSGGETARARAAR